MACTFSDGTGAPTVGPAPAARSAKHEIDIDTAAARNSGVFVGLLEVIGGILSMMAFMAAALWILNRGRPLQNALIAILMPLGIYLVFDVWLRATMPRGLLPLPF